MKVKTLHMRAVVGILLAASVCLIPVISHADNTALPATPPASAQIQSTSSPAEWLRVADNATNQFIVEVCKGIAEDSDAEPNCRGQCIAALHVCTDEKTGEFTPTPQCEKKITELIEACFPVEG